MIHLFTDIVWYYLLLRLREGMPWSFDFFFLCYRKNPQWWLTAQRIQNRREELCGRHGDKGLGIRNSFSKLQVFFVKHILWCFCRTPCPCILWVQAHTRLWFGISNHLSAIKYPLLHRNECSQHDQYSMDRRSLFSSAVYSTAWKISCSKQGLSSKRTRITFLRFFFKIFLKF